MTDIHSQKLTIYKGTIAIIQTVVIHVKYMYISYVILMTLCF